MLSTNANVPVEEWHADRVEGDTRQHGHCRGHPLGAACGREARGTRCQVLGRRVQKETGKHLSHRMVMSLTR